MASGYVENYFLHLRNFPFRAVPDLALGHPKTFPELRKRFPRFFGLRKGFLRGWAGILKIGRGTGQEDSGETTRKPERVWRNSQEARTGEFKTDWRAYLKSAGGWPGRVWGNSQETRKTLEKQPRDQDKRTQNGEAGILKIGGRAAKKSLEKQPRSQKESGETARRPGQANSKRMGRHT